MGVFTAEMGIGDPNGLRYETVDALVDTGATYTAVPASLLSSLDVTPMSMGMFVLADGSRTEREIGQTWVRLEREHYIVPVVFADERSRPILGAVTLEIVRLGIDPVQMRLVPVDALLMRSESGEGTVL